MAEKDSQNLNQKSKKGLFFTFEGIDGCGKTTQMRYLVEHLEELGFQVLTLREPGGTELGEAIRRLLLDKEGKEPKARTELLLFLAARAQLVEEKIRPALAAGTLVICDRFYDSTVAYQGYGRGFDVKVIHELNKLATGGLVPDLTLLLDAGEEAFQARLKRRSAAETDRLDMESQDFLERSRQGFIRLWEQEPERIKLISTARAKSESRAEILELVLAKIKEDAR